jgi:hypothetical protein
MRWLVEMMEELVCQNEVVGSLGIILCRRRYGLSLDPCTQDVGNEENVAGGRKEREQQSQRYYGKRK